MKGKQLSLQEVLNLEDGSVVWVEELKDINMSALHIVDGNYLNDEEKDEAYCFDDIELYYVDDLEFYEWIEEPKEIFDSCVNDGLICKITITKNELLSFFERNEIQIGDEYYRDYCDNDFKEKIDKLFEEFS